MNNNISAVNIDNPKCHSRESGNPENIKKNWIPAFAGMTLLPMLRLITKLCTKKKKILLTQRLLKCLLFVSIFTTCDVPPESVAIKFIPESYTLDISTVFFQFVDTDVTTLERYFFVVVQNLDGEYLSGVEVELSSGIAMGQLFMGSDLSEDSPIYFLDTNFEAQDSPMALKTDKYGRILFGISVPLTLFNQDSVNLVFNIVASIGITATDMIVTISRTAIASAE